MLGRKTPFHFLYAAAAMIVLALLPCTGLAMDEVAAKAGFDKPLNMSLAECVALAIRRNVSIETAYSNRVLQKYDLETDSTFRYVPQVSIDGTAKLAETKDETTSDSHRDDNTSGTVTVAQNIPTGGDFQYTYTKTRDKVTNNASNTYKQTQYTSSWAVTFTQPLLKSAGFDYDLSYYRQAKVTEQTNIVNLKDTVISTVADAISYYRALLSAKHSVDISQESLDIAQKSLDNAQVEVQYGRLAAMDLIQYESSVADSELSLEQARNSYVNARLTLAKHLNLDKKTLIIPSEDIDITAQELDEEKSLQLAYANQPTYLAKKLALENSEYDYLRANRDQLPDLTFTGSYTDTDTTSETAPMDRTDEWNAQLELSTPLFGTDRRTLTSEALSARSAVRINQIELKKMEEDMASDVADSIRDIMVKAKSVKLAERARSLAEQKLQVEQEKRKAGRSTAFQIVTFQSDLSNAKNSELAAKIEYLNALTTFDQYLGTTLDTWKIDFKTERKEAEEDIRKVQ